MNEWVNVFTVAEVNAVHRSDCPDLPQPVIILSQPVPIIIIFFYNSYIGNELNYLYYTDAKVHFMINFWFNQYLLQLDSN